MFLSFPSCFHKRRSLLSRQQKAVRYIALQLISIVEVVVVVVVVATVVRDANVPGSVLPRVEVLQREGEARVLDGRDMLGVRVEEGDSVLHALNLVFSTGEWNCVKQLQHVIRGTHLHVPVARDVE